MTPSIRIGFALAALSIGLLLTADVLFDVVPDQSKALMEIRKRFCEALAVQFSTLAERGQEQAMRRTMSEVVERNVEVISVGLRTADRRLVFATAEHSQSWSDADMNASTLTHARVPIYDESGRWGTLEVHFKPLEGHWHEVILKDPIFRLVVIFASIGFVVYALFMKRTLRYLDPSSVIPGRVKAALDQLVEGVVLLDGELRIVLANDAFASKLERPDDDLIGTYLSRLSWAEVSSDSGGGASLPWERARAERCRVTNMRLALDTPNEGRRFLSCNVSQVTDGDGKARGFLATFDDISQLEELNRELVNTVNRLETSEQVVRQKNVELERLATIDPLTGALNRRAFFAKLDAEFALAGTEALPLTCIMADIDHFKDVNDSYGHAVGDEVIKAMAQLLMDHCPSNGAVGRYGGEEFCVVLPGESHDQAIEIADQIREALSTWSQGPASPTNGNRITSSFGVSSMEFQAPDAAALVDQADQALYHSKTHGRNQVTSWRTCQQDPATRAVAMAG